MADSGLRRAADILMLVGIILRSVTAAVVLIVMVVMAVALTQLADEAGAPSEDEGLALGFVVAMYGVLLVIIVAGLLVGIAARRRYREGTVRGAATLAIVAACLPPVDIIFLLAGIFLFVDKDEGPGAPLPGGVPSQPRWQPR